MADIMVDLETLSTRTDAAVISIGAVAFDPFSDEIHKTFFQKIKLSDVEETQAKRHISATTVAWWMGQSDDARRASFGPTSEAVGTGEALATLADFFGIFGPEVKVWGNGAAFDNVILASLFKDFGWTPPWHFTNDRCYRTMKNLGIGPAAVRVGTHHNPLDDALTQAVHLQNIFKAMRSWSYADNLGAPNDGSKQTA